MGHFSCWAAGPLTEHAQYRAVHCLWCWKVPSPAAGDPYFHMKVLNTSFHLVKKKRKRFILLQFIKSSCSPQDVFFNDYICIRILYWNKAARVYRICINLFNEKIFQTVLMNDTWRARLVFFCFCFFFIPDEHLLQIMNRDLNRCTYHNDTAGKSHMKLLADKVLLTYMEDFYYVFLQLGFFLC